jgi:hypothetical protein
MSKLDVETLRRAVLANGYFITTHAKQRMGLRNVTDEDLKQVVIHGDVVERFPWYDPSVWTDPRTRKMKD